MLAILTAWNDRPWLAAPHRLVCEDIAAALSFDACPHVFLEATDAGRTVPQLRQDLLRQAQWNHCASRILWLDADDWIRPSYARECAAIAALEARAVAYGATVPAPLVITPLHVTRVHCATRRTQRLAMAGQPWMTGTCMGAWLYSTIPYPDLIPTDPGDSDSRYFGEVTRRIGGAGRILRLQTRPRSQSDAVYCAVGQNLTPQSLVTFEHGADCIPADAEPFLLAMDAAIGEARRAGLL